MKPTRATRQRYKKWSAQDDATLKNRAMDEVDPHEIALELKRSYDAVFQRLVKFGYRGGAPKPETIAKQTIARDRAYERDKAMRHAARAKHVVPEGYWK